MVYAAADNRYDVMPYRRVADSGLILPALSFGLWRNLGDQKPLANSREVMLKAFDNGILKGTLDYYDIAEPHYMLLDTVRSSRQLFPDFKNHKLNTVAQNLGITLDHHHNALDDAVAAANILIYEADHFGVESLKRFFKNKQRIAGIIVQCVICFYLFIVISKVIGA